MASTNVVVDKVYRVSLGSKLPWIVPASSIIDVQGQPFIKLSRVSSHNSPWGRLSVGHEHRERSLDASIGMQQLIDMRNIVQSDELRQASSFAVPSFLQDAILAEGSDPSTPKRPRQSRAALQAMRDDGCRQSAVVITVPAIGEAAPYPMMVMRPVNPTDDLWVQLTAANIQAVIDYVRECGFDEGLAKKKRDKTLPRGVWSRRTPDGGEFFMTRSPVDGKLKTTHDVDTAMIVANTVEHDMDADEATVGTAPHVPESGMIGGG